MLSDKNEIDQLFSWKLEHFEKTPPAAVWEGIEARLIYRHRLMTGLKTVSVAATLILACLGGWEMINSAGKLGDQSGHPGEQTAVYTDKNPVKYHKDNNIHLIDHKNLRALVQPPNIKQVPTSKFSLKAAVAANIPLISGNGHKPNLKPGDQVVSVPESKMSLNSLHDQLNIGETQPQTSVPGTEHTTSSVAETKSIVSNAFKMYTSDEAAGVSVVHPNLKRNKRWSLKADFATVLSNRHQNNVQISELNSSGSLNSNVKVNSENSCTAGILAGYKVSKRITVRSGVAYRNIRQTGQNNDDNYLNRQFEYVEVPVQVACKLSYRRLEVSLAGGFSAACLVGNHEVISVNNEQASRGKTANMQSLTYSGLLGLEFGYDITKHITLTFEPRLRHDFNSLSANNSVNYSADHLEIATGLTYCFD